MAKLNQTGMNDKIVLIGGNNPERDIPSLKALGVAGIFPTGQFVR